MESILVKVFATALALSQVMTRPDAVKTEFDAERDRVEVTQLLNAGCTHLRKAFDIEHINLDELIETAMIDKQLTEGEVKGFRGIKFDELHLAYRQICKQEPLEKPAVDIAEVIAFFNATVASLPDHNRLKNLSMPGLTQVFDAKGRKYAELFDADHRRLWVPLSDVPKHVQDAFIAAEDKRFMTHKGVDERSVIRAFIETLANPNKRQGGSTITQQVAKNLLVGDEISYERKIREIIVASRMETVLSKAEILEIYLNAIYLGRSSWGIEMAARSYFGKSAKELTLAEGAFIAGLTKGPNFYNPDRYRERAQGRLAYVLGRMEEDGTLDTARAREAETKPLAFIPHVRHRRDNGFHLVDHLRREAQSAAGIGSLTTTSYIVRSTVIPELQRAAELAVQNGLARYEQGSGRLRFEGPETNIGQAIKRIEAAGAATADSPAWKQALDAVRLPLYDVHWEPAVVLERVRLKNGHESIRVGLRDGRVLPLSTSTQTARNRLATHDVIYATVSEVRNRGVMVQMRVRPIVQASAVVLENSTGRVLAMVGGFSYPLSQLNRATQSRRQPGSAFKPMTYLAALSSGLQPNTMIQDGPITLPPIGLTSRNRIYTPEKDWWSPKNYDGGYSGVMSLRSALEHSKNLVTAHLLDGGVADSPERSLDQICRLAVEAQLYKECERFYPFILGAQPVRVLDMAAFYAAIANEGFRPTPHVIASIEKDGQTVYTAPTSLVALGSTDRPAAFQLKSILQGVLSRGTARSIAHLSPFVGGKTGTTDNENDAWFVGFSNDVTVAVWVGYDNARGKRTLGGGATGSRVAIPIFEPIMNAVWEIHSPRTALRGPSREAGRLLTAVPLGSGRAGTSGGTGPVEYLRLDRTGRLVDTQHRMVSRDHGLLYPGEGWGERLFDFGGIFRRDFDEQPFFAEPRREAPPRRYNYPQTGPGVMPRYEPWANTESYPDASRREVQRARPRPAPPPRERRAAPPPAPDYFWGGRRW